MKKNNILFIGHYLPECSYEVLENYFFCKKLKEEGNEITLLSNSWCADITNGFWGSFDDFTSNDIFCEKYFVDPIQVKHSCCNEIALLGLLKKLMKHKEYEHIIISNFADYGLVAMFLKNKKKCTLLQWGQAEWLKMEDDYMSEMYEDFLTPYEVIATSSIKKDILKNMRWFRNKRVIELDGFNTEFNENNNNVAIVTMNKGINFLKEEVIPSQIKLHNVTIYSFGSAKICMTDEANTIKSKEIKCIKELEEMLKENTMIIEYDELFNGVSDISRLEFWMALGKKIFVTDINFKKVCNKYAFKQKIGYWEVWISDKNY